MVTFMRPKGVSSTITAITRVCSEALVFTVMRPAWFQLATLRACTGPTSRMPGSPPAS
ncbi:hypothetical protein NNJEOMEG_03784 [Fundidesulfovibrio magnetotacticus]|uniref:Uncharacterized protein n=1 Tax=Fundidesulfovibrio magnetotacticus TaxID=2730080 RepID=A0A6V8LZD3_9BACT|nr:hypothetical protein NNJEOMEG_03784 [Fundidesulfovibrio magnetotacticus]